MEVEDGSCTQQPSDAFADDPPPNGNQSTSVSESSSNTTMTQEEFLAEHRRLKLLEQKAAIEAKQQLTRNLKAQEEFYKEAANAQRAVAAFLEAKLGKCPFVKYLLYDVLTCLFKSSLLTIPFVTRFTFESFDVCMN